MTRSRQRGVGLIELLVALAISAALLTAVGVATDTSFKAYAINEEQSGQMQRNRIALNRISTYIRTCKQHQPSTASMVTNFSQGTTVADIGIAMFTDAGVEIDFTYDAAHTRVLMTENGTAREMLRGVTAFQIRMEPMQSSNAIKTGGGFDLLKRATILITTKTTGKLDDIDEAANGQTVSLSASVIPRRNAW